MKRLFISSLLALSIIFVTYIPHTFSFFLVDNALNVAGSAVSGALNTAGAVTNATLGAVSPFGYSSYGYSPYYSSYYGDPYNYYYY